MKAPVLVPIKWLLACLSLSGSAILLAFAIGMWAATISTKQEAMGSEVAKLKNEQPAMREDIVRIKTILMYAFPDEARRVKEGK